MKENNKKSNVDVCVCCGNVIPEGVMVCYECKEQTQKNTNKAKNKGAISLK